MLVMIPDKTVNKYVINATADWINYLEHGECRIRPHNEQCCVVLLARVKAEREKGSQQDDACELRVAVFASVEGGDRELDPQGERQAADFVAAGERPVQDERDREVQHPALGREAGGV